MYNWLGKIIFTSTAIAPVGLTFAVARWNDNIYFSYTSLLLSILCFLIAIFFIRYAKFNFEVVSISPQSVEAADSNNSSLLLIYLSPLFNAQFSDLNWSLIYPSILIFGLVTATGYNYHSNPVLSLIGWHSYKISDLAGVTYVVFTRRQMRDTVAKLSVVQLTEYVLLDRSG